ncbi:MAG: hypothetical protein ACHP7P_15675, partial [Terriglobales bacterium]
LQADTAAIKSTSAGDKTYTDAVARLTRLDQRRDQLAQRIKNQLEAAAFEGAGVSNARGLTRSCDALIDQATSMAG